MSIKRRDGGSLEVVGACQQKHSTTPPPPSLFSPAGDPDVKQQMSFQPDILVCEGGGGGTEHRYLLPMQMDSKSKHTKQAFECFLFLWTSVRSGLKVDPPAPPAVNSTAEYVDQYSPTCGTWTSHRAALLWRPSVCKEASLFPFGLLSSPLMAFLTCKSHRDTERD